MAQLEAPPAVAAPPVLRGSLGVTAIVFMVVAAAAPLTVVGGAAPLGILLGNGIGYPALYIVAAVILLLFAVGLAAMTRHVPKPGAFFTYVGYGLGRSSGLAAAWVAMLAYTTIQIAVYGYLGYVLSYTVQTMTHVQLPWWIFSLLVIGLVALLGYRHIDLSSKVLGVVLVAEVGIVLVLVAVVIVRGGPQGLSLAPFAPANVLSGSPGVGLMMAIAAFIGFEAAAIFRDEARDPDRTIPRATYTAVIGIGVFYTLAGWGLVMAWGPDHVVAEAAKDPGSLILRTMAVYLGTAGEVITNVLLITSMLACVLSFHNVLTRYQHSMSHAGVLPERVGAVHHRHLSPHVSSLVQTATAILCTVVFAALGLDPVLAVFTWFSGVATVAIALLMAATSAAVIVYFRRTRKDARVWNTVIAPGLGVVGLMLATALIVVNFPVMVGDVDPKGAPTFGPLCWFLLLLVAVFPIIGYAQARWIRIRRPAAYAKLIDTIAG
ncbi:Amino acid transporter [Microbacterium sp. 8M]|uniref:APC family permease n=1 Tax=Microbacterium sp. 8M TaxID=2653153 RepID=UPI0012F02469|nr:APC family permease [Microbacterium sp. 8M]VXB40424.1 Amino acid transporter [Microbacterium sp. 8M]